MKTIASICLFVLTVLGMSLGVVAGTVALASLITETAARAATNGADHLAAHLRVSPPRLQLRDELAGLFATEGATR